MKKLLIIIGSMLVVCSYSQIIDLDAHSYTTSFTGAEYNDKGYMEWNIDVGVATSIVFDVNVDIDGNDDEFMIFYAINEYNDLIPVMIVGVTTDNTLWKHTWNGEDYYLDPVGAVSELYWKNSDNTGMNHYGNGKMTATFSISDSKQAGLIFTGKAKVVFVNKTLNQQNTETSFSFSYATPLNSTITYAYDASGNRTSRTYYGTVVVPHMRSAKFPNHKSDNIDQPKITESQLTSNLKVKIYPIPTYGVMKLEIVGIEYTTHSGYTIYDTYGKSVATANTLSALQQINIQHLPPANYVMILHVDGEDYCWKVIKK